MKEFKKVKIANTKFEKGINYFGSLDSICIDGKIHHVGSSVLALCVLTDKDGWKNKINFQEGLSFSGDIGQSASINKNGILYVVAINGGVHYLENNTWITEYEPDDTLAKKWLFAGNYDPENDRIVISGGYSGKPGKYTANNDTTYVYKKGKWSKISNAILKQECKENLALRKSKPYEHISNFDIVQCYDYQLKQIILIGGSFSYTLNGAKWDHFETKGLDSIALISRRIFHIKSLKKTFILAEDGILYEYTKESLTPYAKIDLKGLTFYNCSCQYSDEKELLHLFNKEGDGYTVKIS